MKIAINNFEKLFDPIYKTSNQKEYLSFHKKRFKYLYGVICKLNPKKILDIGESGFTQILKKSGYNVCVLNKGECNLEIDKPPYKNNSFNLVLYTEVIEHLHKNYTCTLKEIHRILKPEGFLLFGTPNAKSLRKIFHIGKINKEHIREFSMQECLMMLQNSGFNIVFRKFMPYLDLTKRCPIHFAYYFIAKFIPRFRESIFILGIKTQTKNENCNISKLHE